MEERDHILEHGQDYDGIKEYDNPLPQWFVLMFYGTIAFAFLYAGYYTGKTWGVKHATGLGQNLAYSGARLAVQMREEDGLRHGRPFEAPQGEALQAFLKAPGNATKGEALYKANCVACHGEEGQGVVGPNLTDQFWLHGGKAEDVLKSVSDGWIANGMPAWGPPLGAQKAHWLTAYVMSLKGRPVSNPKEPQGVEEP